MLEIHLRFRRLTACLAVPLLLSRTALADCAPVLNQNENGRVLSAVNTRQMIGYLETLLRLRTLPVQNVLQLRRHLQDGRVINPLVDPESEEVPESERLIHSERIQEYLDAGIDLEMLRSWAEETSRAIQRRQSDRVKSQETSTNPWRDPEFIRVRSGRMNRKGKEILIPYDYEIMTTMVTRYMWDRWMHGLPQLPDGEMDLPVTNITWWAAAQFANRYSLSRGLPEVYDLSFIKGDRSTWGNGQVCPHAGDPPIGTSDEILRSRGFRLPTASELAFIYTQRGEVSEWSPEEEQKRCWSRDYPELQPVISKDPFRIDGKSVWGVFDNVGHFLSNWMEAPPHMEYGTVSFSVFGGSSVHVLSGRTDFHVGLRLVRTLGTPSKAP